MRTALFLFLSVIFSTLQCSSPQRAVVISPVADLLGQPHYRSGKKGVSLEEYYHDIPFSGNGNTCQRLHQVLFNEVVDVLEIKGLEAKIRIPNFYYIRHNESTLHDTYWIAKKHLLFLDESKHNKISLKLFPPPISYKKKRLPHNKDHNVVTLKKPFYDALTQKTYSVGTRFLAVDGQNLSGSYDKGSFLVYMYDTNKHLLLQTKVPKRICIRNYFTKPEEQIHNYVQVLRSWTVHKEGIIPYVLGGFSWTTSCESNDYHAIVEPHSQHPYFHRSNWPHESKQGFDCVGIIARAAQICDIPFFFKNTLTLLKGLSPLKKNESIKEGDLIWYPGHVMVVSNLKENLIIEARGYDHGFGKVRECPISEIFQEAKNFDELIKLHTKHLPVSVLDSEGKSFMRCKTFKILKMRSAWKMNETTNKAPQAH